MRETAVQVMGYFGGAVAGLALDWCAWSAVLLLTGQPLLSQGIGKGAGAVLAFFLYRRVFKGDKVRQQILPKPSHGQARRFFQAVLAGWCVSMCLFSICIYLSGQQYPVMCKVVTDGMTFVLNWFVMKSYVFPVHAREQITPVHERE